MAKYLVIIFFVSGLKSRFLVFKSVQIIRVSVQFPLNNAKITVFDRPPTVHFLDKKYFTIYFAVEYSI